MKWAGMRTEDAIRSRRAVKYVDANHSMTDKEVNELLSLAVLSPTAFNLQNWRFVACGLRQDGHIGC
jgi:nitroreductase